jgi:hypothetical protein
MKIPIRPEDANTKAFALVETKTEADGEGHDASPRQRFEKRAEEIARAAERHTRRMMENEAALLANGVVPSGVRARDPETRDTIPFGLQRRVVLRVPVFRREAWANDEELRKIRGLMAQIALDLIAQVLEINRYFAEAGLVRSPELVSARPGSPDEAPAGKTMSRGSDGSSLRRRA